MALDDLALGPGEPEAAPIDRYVVLEHLSKGGMGAIYVGKKLGAGGFEMEVVLKQLLPELTQQEEHIDPSAKWTQAASSAVVAITVGRERARAA